MRIANTHCNMPLVDLRLKKALVRMGRLACPIAKRLHPVAAFWELQRFALLGRFSRGVLSTRPTTADVIPIASGRDPQLLLDVGHHRVRQARLAELRKVFGDDVLP